MIDKNKVMLLIVVVVALVFILGYYSLLPESPQTPVMNVPLKIQEPERQEVVPPPATGDIDDVVDALMKELSDEEPLFKEEEDDTELVDTEQQEIDDFGQSVNESGL